LSISIDLSPNLFFYFVDSLNLISVQIDMGFKEMYVEMCELCVCSMRLLVCSGGGANFTLCHSRGLCWDLVTIVVRALWIMQKNPKLGEVISEIMRSKI